jgi:hypothetical protein
MPLKDAFWRPQRFRDGTETLTTEDTGDIEVFTEGVLKRWLLKKPFSLIILCVVLCVVLCALCDSSGSLSVLLKPPGPPDT